MQESPGNVNLSDFRPLVLLNGFTYSERMTIYKAARAVAGKIAAVWEGARQYWSGKLGEDLPAISSQEAFYKVYGGPVKFIRKDVTATDFFYPHNDIQGHANYGKTSDAWGWTISQSEIWVFANASPEDVSSTLYFPTHELGHAFDQLVGLRGRSSVTVDIYNSNRGYGRGIIQNFDYGGENRHEVFANMFTGWVYNKWDLTVDIGILRRAFMNNLMPGFILP